MAGRIRAFLDKHNIKPISLIERVEQDGLAGLEHHVALKRGVNPQSWAEHGHRNELMVIADKAGMDGLRLFFDHGGALSPYARDGIGNTEMVHMVRAGNLDGLKLFFDKGGKPNHSAVSSIGMNEVAIIAMHTKMDGLKLFLKNGGAFQSGKSSDALWVAPFCGIEGLQLFVDHGGQFNSNARLAYDRTETSEIVRTLGLDGLSFLLDHGVTLNPDHPAERRAVRNAFKQATLAAQIPPTAEEIAAKRQVYTQKILNSLQGGPA
ncbi:hypothetical protein [Micavibrio aeruginosavorus]|uniref:hypothetical protein n=1 Tax=Micavibrio aeruginosavorus TaxID=349221 RepID=UPI003F4AD9E8